MPCREREESAARCGPKGPPLIERLPPAPLLKKSLCKTKSASIVTAAGGLQMDPSPREECESGPWVPSEVGGHSQCFQHGERSLVPTLVLTMWFLCFESLNYPWKTEGRKKVVKDVHSFRSQHLPILPTTATSVAIPVHHSKSTLVKLPMQICFLTTDFSHKSAVTPEHLEQREILVYPHSMRRKKLSSPVSKAHDTVWKPPWWILVFKQLAISLPYQKFISGILLGAQIYHQTNFPLPLSLVFSHTVNKFSPLISPTLKEYLIWKECFPQV